MSNPIYHGRVKCLASQADAIGRLLRLYRNPRRIYLAVLVLLTVGATLSITLLVVQPPTVRAQTIPTNASASAGCPVAAATFKGWFTSGTPSVNGEVNPANSVTFAPTSLCSFYQWSEQMFLWLLSPAPAAYGGGAHIFDSPTFYDVSPPNSSGQRTLTQHKPGHFPIVGVRIPTPGPHGLPVIMDKNNHVFEVEPAKLAPNGKQLILNNAGKEVEVESAAITQGKVVFKDTTGKAIASPKAILRPELLQPAAPKTAPRKAMAKGVAGAQAQAAAAQIAQRFIFNGKPIFINPLGGLVTPVNPEEGQATGNALVSQVGGPDSLVFYTIVVNDVYAYFLTGNKTGHITPAATQFPTSAAELAKVTAFASSKGVTFPDPNALTVEIKMSWVNAATIPGGSGNYITVSAQVPKYNTTSTPGTWVDIGTQPMTLALVGVHFVATVAGHPEMIWATFEHFGNTPNAAYTYTPSSGPNKTIPADGAGNWLFCVHTGCPTSPTNINQSLAQLSPTNPANLIGVPPPPGPPPPGSPAPSNTRRTNPWGLSGTAASSVSSNTQIVSINNSVLSQLLSGDMRKNYFMIGATWTFGGWAPSKGQQVGTNFLANSTMETTVQGGSNCFTCHVDSGVGVPAPPPVPPPPPPTPPPPSDGSMLGGGLSHIYGPLQPLP